MFYLGRGRWQSPGSAYQPLAADLNETMEVMAMGTRAICSAVAAVRRYHTPILMVNPVSVAEVLNGGCPNGHLSPEENVLMKIHVSVPTFVPPPRVFYCHN